MTRRMRLTITGLALGALALPMLACGFGGDDDAPPPPTVEAQPAAPPPAQLAAIPAVPENLPRPQLSYAVTGSPSHDPAVEIPRCELTSWSYTGCAATYPTQGRQFVEWECRTTPSPTIRAIVCGRWAEYRIRGIGGPVERAAGIAMLDQLCNDGDRVQCAVLAQAVIFDDFARARAATERGCSSPTESPVGLCETLRGITSDSRSIFRPIVESATGLPGVTNGTSCRAWIHRHAPDCRGYLECGDRVLYGREWSQFPCVASDTEVRGGEDMTTGQDGDAAFLVDSPTGTLFAHDDASGPFGAYSVRLRL